MDFIVSYHLYNQMKKKESSKSNQIKSESLEESDNKVNYTCPRCGQDPYFCQCKNNIKTMYKYFNPEKDNY